MPRFNAIFVPGRRSNEYFKRPNILITYEAPSLEEAMDMMESDAAEWDQGDSLVEVRAHGSEQVLWSRFRRLAT